MAVQQRVVFVHGNLESDAVWGPLRGALDGRDVLCLSPPGFGAPVPAGFGCTMGDYRDWLVGQLEAVGSPVHLVGHDWGGAHVVNVAMTRPDLLRSWASDVVGLFHPDYVWHDLARRWQTPGDGEISIAGMLGGTRAERTSRMVARGIDRPVAERLADAQGEEMARAVLALYRSAAQPVMADAGRGLPAAAARPGVSILATEDPFIGPPRLARDAAELAGASLQTLDGLGHWWMVQDPERSARTLQRFWASLPN